MIVRQILIRLKAAGLIEVSRGKGDIKLRKPLENISMYDVYKAAEIVKGKLFRFHSNPNPECPVGKNIHFALDESLDDIQNALEEKMKTIYLQEIAEKIKIPPK